MTSNARPQPAAGKPGIEIVCATRFTEAEFWAKSALGQSIGAIAFDPCISTRIRFENRDGLPSLYNESIDSDNANEILLFIHDDVWLHDYYFVDRIIEGLAQYELIGLIGNTRRTDSQVAWFSKGATLEPNLECLSGVIGQGPNAPGGANYFGPSPAACEFLDGFFLASRKKTLREHAIAFDPAFDFHFYDMDLCRQARQKNLRIGTWNISVTHQSLGGYDNPAWREKCALYLEKWPV
jgi:GT2 family glycosyltransferase